jgi:hypothetical protein
MDTMTRMERTFMVAMLAQAPDWSTFRHDNPRWALALVIAVVAAVLLGLVSLLVNSARRRRKREVAVLKSNLEALAQEFRDYRRAILRSQFRPHALTEEDRALIDKYAEADNL